MSTRLSRAAVERREGAPARRAPVRIVHFGLGAFHRAHQAWYTHAVDDEHQWGIAAFTGRSPAAAEELAPQDGLFTLIERSASSDVATIIRSIVEVFDGAHVDRLVELVAAPTTAIITLTITEAGYCVTDDGAPNFDDPAVAADAAILRGLGAAAPSTASASATTTALARIVLGLAGRRSADGGPIAIVPCDNMPGNGRIVETAITALAACVSSELAIWVAENVSFVSTSVDRITPKATADDRRTAEELTGFADRAPVVTELFRDWVLEGSFPQGRPEWERVGARFVSDIEPFERRKLWLLNGAHSLLACAGQLRGFETVAEAIADPVLRQHVSELWDEAARQLPDDLGLDAYRVALLARFENGRIEHRLAQIATDSALKMAVRVAPVARAERAAGREAAACARAIASWVALVRSGRASADSRADDIAKALEAPAAEADEALVALIDPVLAADTTFLNLVVTFVRPDRALASTHLKGEPS